MVEQRRVDGLWDLVGQEVAGARDHLETVGPGDAVSRAFGGGAADRGVGVAPDIKRWRGDGRDVGGAQ